MKINGLIDSFTETYAYDALNRLTSRGFAQDKRDSRKVSGTQTTTEHYYAGGYEKIVQTQGRSPGLVEHKYHLMGGNIVITHRSNGTKDTHYLHKDTQGSVSLITNASGHVIAQYIYDPFGKQTTLTRHWLFAQGIYQLPTHQGYTGHHELSDVGIIHMNGRIYDPTLGRFLQADPIIQAPKNSQNYNRYSYVLNNPLRYTDPSGYNFFEKIARPFKNVFRSVFRTIGQTASKWLVNIGSMFCGPAYAACVAAGNYDIARAYGANKTGALRGAFSSGVMAYVGGPPSNVNIVQIAADIVDPKIGRVVNFLYNGFDSKSFVNTALNLTHEVKNYYVSKEIARFARKNGMTLQELNALLTLNSFVGKKVTGSRMRPSKDGSKNDIFGFTSRRGGLIENKTVAGYIGVLWDVNDTILGYQGLLDAVGHDFIVNGTGKIGNCHSLGTLTCNNLVARGYAESATLNSLPFGNIAVGANARQTMLGYGDPINFFGFGLLLNRLSHGTPCSGGGFGFECHGFDDNYSELKL